MGSSVGVAEGNAEGDVVGDVVGTEEGLVEGIPVVGDCVGAELIVGNAEGAGDSEGAALAVGADVVGEDVFGALDFIPSLLLSSLSSLSPLLDFPFPLLPL